MAIHYMNAQDLRGVIVLYKCVFLIPNLKRKIFDELPSGSYICRGMNGRYKKVDNKKKMRF